MPEQTKIPVVCVDLYPFFGPNDPNGPHTDAASKGFFRRNAMKMLDAIGDRPAVGWVMGMCFSDIWDPRRYDDNGHLIGLSDSYLHWRCPTLPEMRWQVWESFRWARRGLCVTHFLVDSAIRPWPYLHVCNPGRTLESAVFPGCCISSTLVLKSKLLPVD